MGKRKGFTIIEVIMFVAISAALFIGVAVGMQSSIFQQRYNDTTQSFVEFLRSMYSEVMNPQSNGAGNSELALYGKLIVFGEDTDITGASIGGGGDKPIFTYDVVGDASVNAGAGNVLDSLLRINANVVMITKDSSNKVIKVESVDPSKYTPHFGAYIEKADPDTSGVNSLYTGSILIVRHPTSGVVNTLSLNKVIEVNKKVDEINDDINGGGTVTTDEEKAIRNLLTDYLDKNAAQHFETGEIDFCINPYAETIPVNAVLKRNVRIILNARNASGIELIDLDSSDNRCN